MFLYPNLSTLDKVKCTEIFLNDFFWSCLSTLDNPMRLKVLGNDAFVPRPVDTRQKRYTCKDKAVMGNTIEIQTNVDSSLQVLREGQVKVES
jgi:hypothetical protein